MLTNEKEYNGYLFDQLTILERLEEIAIENHYEKILKAIEFEKKAVKRKLYQTPPLIDESEENR